MSSEHPTNVPDDRPAEAATPVATTLARAWSLRTMVAAAITTVALSGLAGAGLATAGEGAASDGRTGRGGFGGPPGQAPGQFPGQDGVAVVP